ncbi:MAG: 5-(carboxyamino)imidazole ribonucleotide synthase [Candidatus Omnitrophica bacterium]|nr:5-(carboxyamino)imidazole ribonucleotide synthase [Candidatus Omnitrophota bacterium]
MTQTYLPGSVIGVLGSGQLGRMFAIAARQMGYRVHALSPDNDTPAGQVADVEIQAPYEDLDSVAQFASRVDVITFEFENVPSKTTEVAERHAPVRPAGSVLNTTQNRIREKTFLRESGLPVTPFAPIRSEGEIRTAIETVGLPGVLKTASWGYDGKGQAKVDSEEQLREAWNSMERQEAVFEGWVDFESEISVVAGRGLRGEIACYDPILNLHRNHILDVSISPSGIPPKVAEEAAEIARTVVEKLEVIGVLCVEMFLKEDGSLLVNELAPRPHNSGHLTIDAHTTSQFEQQVRAVCGLPLGSTQQLRPAAMANLLGDLWNLAQPDWYRACSLCDLKLHLYGKREARPGRKMGHLTGLASTSERARALVLEARDLLNPRIRETP